jgi:tetratricopeptide (TPR) repeat protein
LATSEKHKRLLKEEQLAADSKAKLRDAAERNILNGKIPQAISEYLKIVSIDPEDVLVLNTIGDLYLRLNNTAEAGKYFSKVAENYVQNNFSLKALAVYKKILQADPNNLEINSITASLYAKQGLNSDARNQYLRVAALLEQEGKSKESLDAYEKVVELDPLNADIQRKLAAHHQAMGSKDKAQQYWAGAARAQVRTGDLQGAVSSFENTLKLAPLDEDSLRGFIECCLKIGNPSPVLNQLKQSAEKAPQNPNIHEMLGRAYLESGDPSGAAKAFQDVVAMDPARYGNLFPVAQAFLTHEMYDQAIFALDPIIPILISRWEPERAAQIYEQILQLRPKYIPALTKLAALYLAIGEQTRYLETMDVIADCFLNEKRPVEALEYLEKILQDNPESKKHRELHCQAFAEAYPNTPYVPLERSPQSSTDAASRIDVIGPEIEVDLASDFLNGLFLNDPPATDKVIDSQPQAEAIPEAPDALSQAPAKSVQVQLEDVDFYIQLGFHNEALGKLNEIAKDNPNHPELALRYQKLGETPKTVQEPIPVDDSGQTLGIQFSEESAAEIPGDFQLLEFEDALSPSQEDPAETILDSKDLESLWNSIPAATEPVPQHTEPSQNKEPAKPAESRSAVNDMFADLLEEIQSTDQDEARADFEEHFSLGTAYREMGLINEAIKEFEAALKAIDMQEGDPRAIQCCGMLSTCFLNKNMPRSALRWCQAGLDLVDISSHEALAFRYDMGVAHAMDGSKDQALECFDQIFHVDPSYRDVAKKIDELRGGSERHAS